jgi:hypothetical protein
LLQDPIYCGNLPLNMILLEVGPDFAHVVTLKGEFLYVAPSVRRVLGYEPGDLVGATMADIAHRDDLVPLMRELKESTSIGFNASVGGSILGVEPRVNPHTVELLFRARTKNGVFVWVESRGRLHGGPSTRGRKAISLWGRARDMSHLTWEMVARAGGLAKCTTVQKRVGDGNIEYIVARQEFWGMVSRSGVLITVGSGIKDLLGWEPEDFEGLAIGNLVATASGGGEVERSVKKLGNGPGGGGESMCVHSILGCDMKTKEGGSKPVVVSIFRGWRDPKVQLATEIPGGIRPAHLVYQVRLASAETYSLRSPSPPPHAPVLPSHDLAHLTHFPLIHPSPATTLGSAGEDHLFDASHLLCPSTSGSPAQLQSYDPRYPDLGANIFQAFNINRNTCWQYEIQQLKLRNEAVKVKILRLEAALRIPKGRKATQEVPRSPCPVRNTCHSLQKGARFHQLHPQGGTTAQMQPPNISIDLSHLDHPCHDPLGVSPQGVLLTQRVKVLSSPLQPIDPLSPTPCLPLSTQFLSQHSAWSKFPAGLADALTSSPSVRRVQGGVSAQVPAQGTPAGCPEYVHYCAPGPRGGTPQRTAGKKRRWHTMASMDEVHPKPPHFSGGSQRR